MLLFLVLAVNSIIPPGLKFTELHTLPLAAHSYALLVAAMKSINDKILQANFFTCENFPTYGCCIVPIEEPLTGLCVCKSKDVKWVARQVENEDCMMQADEEHSRMQVLSIVTGTLAEDRTEQ